MNRENEHPTNNSSIFLRQISELLESRGQRFFDAHGHLDREETLRTEYYEHVNVDPWKLATEYSLQAKRDAVGYLHDGPAYRNDKELERRLRARLLQRVQFGIGRFDTCIDTTPDIGLRAFDIALRFKEEFRESGLDLRVGAYPLWGFKRPEENPDRLNLFYEASERADFLCGLPERDDAPNRIGFKGHIRIILERAIELGKPAHFHLDQVNDPEERGTETLIEAVSWFKSPEIPDLEEPTVWAVHCISPSAYPEERFWRMVEGLVKFNIGVICCPRAAVSMRQLGCIVAPTHNSIARILEMLYAGIWVRIGSDNIGDVFVPTGTGDLRREIAEGANALRFYAPPVWYKLAIGADLNESDREMIRTTLSQHYDVLRQRVRRGQIDEESTIPPWTLPRY